MYTCILDEGIVIRDADGVVVSPTHDDTTEDFQNWKTWCESGNSAAIVPTRGLGEIPQSVTRRQMLIALNRMGLKTVIENLIEASGEDELKIDYYEAQTFERDNPALAAMAEMLNKSVTDIDRIFVLAASVK